MPQVFQVLRCYKCFVFQVHQTKKTNKWQCKMCGEKQSVKRHYGIGTGKDCRLHVQKLNTIRGDTEESHQNLVDSDQDSISSVENCEEKILDIETKIQETENSKWNAFIDESYQKLEYTEDSDFEDQKPMSVKPHASKYETKIRNNKRRKISTNILDQVEPKINFESNFNSNSWYSQPNSTIVKNKDIKQNRSIGIDNCMNKKQCGNLIDTSNIQDGKWKKYNMEKDMEKVYFNETEINNVKDSTNFPHVISNNAQNSKWANYIDENEESNTSDDETCPSTQNISLEFAQFNHMTEDNLNIKQYKFKNSELEYLKENCNKEISSHGEHILEYTKLIDKTNNKLLQNKKNCKENLINKNSPNIFSLCDDNELDDILDF